MKRQATFCDRCKNEILLGQGGRVTNQGREYDLCDPCSQELDTFIEKPQPPRVPKIPKGYKRVARPCPHFVPCTEPWGCSGEEIVPESDPREDLAEIYAQMRNR